VGAEDEDDDDEDDDDVEEEEEEPVRNPGDRKITQQPPLSPGNYFRDGCTKIGTHSDAWGCLATQSIQFLAAHNGSGCVLNGAPYVG